MSNSADTFDDFVTDQRDHEPSGDGGGALMAVLITLFLGCGLVFTAYKLGQRTGVDDPPLLGAANNLPVKVAPADPGGAQIASTNSASNALIDQRPVTVAGTAYSTDANGVVISRQLPARNVTLSENRDPASVNRSRIAIEDLAPVTTIEGAPQLASNGPVDRTLESIRAGGAEIVVPVEGRRVLPLATLAPESERTVIAAPSFRTPAQRAREERAQVGAAMARADLGYNPGSGLLERQQQETQLTFVSPLPKRKPPIAARAIRTETVAASQRVLTATPAATRRIEPAVGRVPAQPLGDAQVQLGAMNNPNDVRREWYRLQSAHPDLLGNLGLQVLPAPPANGAPVFRLRVGPLQNGREAAELCSMLNYRGVACFVPKRS